MKEEYALHTVFFPLQCNSMGGREHRALSVLLKCLIAKVFMACLVLDVMFIFGFLKVFGVHCLLFDLFSLSGVFFTIFSKSSL